MGKKVNILLHDCTGMKMGYVVKEMTNTVEFNIGQRIPRGAVEKLCAKDNYTVKIKTKG